MVAGRRCDVFFSFFSFFLVSCIMVWIYKAHVYSSFVSVKGLRLGLFFCTISRAQGPGCGYNSVAIGFLVARLPGGGNIRCMLSRPLPQYSCLHPNWSPSRRSQFPVFMARVTAYDYTELLFGMIYFLAAPLNMHDCD